MISEKLLLFSDLFLHLITRTDSGQQRYHSFSLMTIFSPEPAHKIIIIRTNWPKSSTKLIFSPNFLSFLLLLCVVLLRLSPKKDKLHIIILFLQSFCQNLKASQNTAAHFCHHTFLCPLHCEPVLMINISPSDTSHITNMQFFAFMMM